MENTDTVLTQSRSHVTQAHPTALSHTNIHTSTCTLISVALIGLMVILLWDGTHTHTHTHTNTHTGINQFKLIKLLPMTLKTNVQQKSTKLWHRLGYIPFAASKNLLLWVLIYSLLMIGNE